jgi:flagellin-like protein
VLIKNMLKSKKAISPILATLLLIVIAVAAIVVTYAWIMTYMSSAGQQAGVTLYKANYSFGGGGTTISIDVGNSGTSDTEIIKVYVGTSLGNRVEQTPTQTIPISLAAGSIEPVTINYNWTNGTTYYFRILSSTGQALEFPEQAPAS